MKLDKQTVENLVEETYKKVGNDHMYSAALHYVDFEALQTQQQPPLRQDELCATFAVAGFLAGVKFVLEHLDSVDDKGGESEK